MAKKILIIGTGSQARVVKEILYASSRVTAGFVLPENCRESYEDISLAVQSLPVYDWKKACSLRNEFDFIVGIGDNRLRRIAFEAGESAGFEFVSAIHPDAVIGSGTEIGPGTVIAAHATCVLEVKTGRGVIINTGASVDHDCVIGDWCHIGPGSVLAGKVRLGSEVFVGAGGVVIQEITIGDGTVLGAGAVVVRNLPCHVLAVGVPATIIPIDKG